MSDTIKNNYPNLKKGIPVKHLFIILPILLISSCKFGPETGDLYQQKTASGFTKHQSDGERKNGKDWDTKQRKNDGSILEIFENGERILKGGGCIFRI